LVPGIRVKGLRKEFSKLGSRKRVLAVDGVSFSAYPGQITTLLGHNGAGNLQIKKNKIDHGFVEDLGPRCFVD
jgi:ABC-type Na+ transport system ATPase subunit NatA